MDRAQLLLVTRTILDAALDRIESGLPDCICWEDRLDMMNKFDDNPLEPAAYERGALETAGMDLAILARHATGEGLGIEEALAYAGDFDKACEKMLAESWENKGKGGAILHRPDTRRHAEAFVNECIPE